MFFFWNTVYTSVYRFLKKPVKCTSFLTFLIMLFQKHFDNAQYESHRADGLRKLRPDAVPMVFEASPVTADRRMKRKQYSKQGTCQIIAVINLKYPVFINFLRNF